MASNADEQRRFMYDRGVMLAPMVRIGTLPSRLLSLQYGADIAYTEEMIDFRMLKTTRIENELLDTVDYVMDDGTVALQISPLEKGRVIFQLGTSHPKRALKVAKMVERDVAGVDINMGCPKTFSISGGMGAALLKQPQLAKEILTELVSNLSIPVTCKIRCLDTLDETLQFAKMAESTGIAALAIHGRTRDERPKHKCRYSYIREVSDALRIPVIANGGSGEIKVQSDIERFRVACGANSVMVARAAEWNLSIFRKEGLLSKEQLILEYIKVAIDYDNHWTNTKYCIQQILGSDVQSEQGTQLLASKCPEDIYAIYNMMDYYNEVNSRHNVFLQKKKEIEERDYDTVKGLKVKIIRDDEGHVISYESNHLYDRKVSEGNQTPKMYLYNYLKKNKPASGSKPTFNCEVEEGNRRFRCTLDFDGVKYISNRWHKRKMWAEQAVSQIYMQLNDIGEWKFDDSVESSQTASSHNGSAGSCSDRVFTLNKESIAVSVSTGSNGSVVSYSSSHHFYCDTTKGSSPMDRLCLYLLEKQMEEPEYDTVMGSEDTVRRCTLRHAGIEYITDTGYESKKEATNATCQLYLLVHNIATTSVGGCKKAVKRGVEVVEEHSSTAECHKLERLDNGT